CLRHTFATDMLNAGLRLEVLQQLLGHQSAEITRRYAKMSDVTGGGISGQKTSGVTFVATI
ncbi:MAG: site-specific integrase, partial [Desulfobulbaceae bacterium]